MNGAATRRAMSPTAVEGSSLEQSFAQSVFASQPQTRGRNRGKSLARGLPVQVAYATIDAILVCMIGAAVLWARFGIGLLLGPERQLFDGAVGHAYVGVFLLYSALVVISAGALNVVALSGWRYFKRRFLLRRTAEGIGVSRVLIVGAGRMGMALAEWLQRNPHLGYSVCGFLDDQASSDSRVLGKLSDLRHLALTQFLDELFITLPSDREVVKTMVFEARQLRLGLKIVPDIYDGLGWRAPLHMIGGFPVMDLHWQPIPAVGLAVKRVLDVLVSGFALIVTAPLLAVFAILIRIDSPGPSLYVADRVGLKGRRFRCYKFRTMVVDANFQKEKLRSANDRHGPFFKMENDPRITRLRYWLRKSSLDELPQLWNVLRGDMSLVGPRPHPIDDFERYAIEHLRRLDVSPGLTGLWQVTARSDPSFETSMALDLEYIENWTLGLDLAILLKTLPALLRGDGR